MGKKLVFVCEGGSLIYNKESKDYFDFTDGREMLVDLVSVVLEKANNKLF